MEKDEFTEALEATKNKTIYYKIAMVKREIGTLTKKSDNPFFKSKYLELSDLLEAVEPLLDKWGLLLLQPIMDERVFSQIIDVEDPGQTVESWIQLTPNNNPQQLGSQISYFRRYTLSSLLSIAQVDDDANHASKPTKETLNDERFNKALDRVSEGTYTADKIKAQFALTPIQIAELDKLVVDMAIDGK